MSVNAPSASPAEQTSPAPKKQCPKLRYIPYGAEKESSFLPAIKQLISKDLSEPYSIYVYRYFLYQWGHLCFMVRGILSHVAPFDRAALTSSRHWTSKTISSVLSFANSNLTVVGPCEATSPCWPRAKTTAATALLHPLSKWR